MTDYVSSYKEVDIGKYKYNIFFVCCPEGRLPLKNDNRALNVTYDKLDKQGKEIGRQLKHKGAFVLFYEENAKNTARQVMDKEWPKPILEKMGFFHSPFACRHGYC